jgi:hypothetical protein
VVMLRRAIAVGRGVLSELDPDVLLDRVLETAREITGARYAALGVLNASRLALERFLVLGIDQHERLAIGDLPPQCSSRRRPPRPLRPASKTQAACRTKS